MTTPANDVLTPVLRRRLGDDSLRCTTCVEIEAGHDRETWLLTVQSESDSRELMLRRTTSDTQAARESLCVEAAVMTALRATGLRIPPVVTICLDTFEVGRPYLLVERGLGKPSTRLRRTLRPFVAEQIAELLPRVHQAPADILGAPRTRTEAVRDRLKGWRARYFTDRPFPVPMLLALIEDLIDRVPEDDEPACVVWGHPGAHGVLTDDSGRVTALLRWEHAHLGSPLEEIGHLIWNEREYADQWAIVSAYEGAAGMGVETTDLRFFVAMSCVLHAAIALPRIRRSDPSDVARGLHTLLANLGRAANLLDWPAAAQDWRPTASPVPDVDPAELLPSIAEWDRVLARFLVDRVLPAIDDPVVARELRSAAALLRTTVERGARAGDVRARRQQLAAQFDQAVGGPASTDQVALERIVTRTARDRDLLGQRELVRRYLRADLGEQRPLISPIEQLFGH